VQPIVFRIGPFALRFYGLMYVTALLVGIWLLRLEAKRRHLPPERMVDLAFYMFVGGLLGGRLYYVLFKWGSLAGSLAAGGLPVCMGCPSQPCAIWLLRPLA
jgi:phosphatidylglycerol---prolipoprotein diacylglyceryl transferase